MTAPRPSGGEPRLTRERLESLLLRMAQRRIVVVGDAILDIYLAGDAERISPEAPVPVVTVERRRHALGGAANVAANVAAIGAEGRLVAVVGDDQRGTACAPSSRRAGCRTSSSSSRRRVPPRPRRA